MKFKIEKSLNVSNLSWFEICLLSFPFLLFTIIYTFWKNPTWENWVSGNKIIAFIILFGTLFALLLRQYKQNWFLVWLGFSIYYSPNFILDRYFLIKAWEFIMPSDLKHSGFLYIFPNDNLFYIFLSLSFVTIFLLFFKCKKDKIFLFLFSYYFVCCYFLSYVYNHYLAYTRNLSIDWIWMSFRAFVILNSIFSFLYLVFSLLLRRKVLKIVLFLFFILLNFFAINLFRFKEIFIDRSFGNPFSELLKIIVIYTHWFLLLSNFIYFLLFVILYRNPFFIKIKKMVV